MARRRRRRPADRTRLRAGRGGVGQDRRAAAWRPFAPPSTGTRSSPTGRTEFDFSVTDRWCWPPPSAGSPCCPSSRARRRWAARNPGDPASPPRDPEDFARLLTALVARYGPNGSLWAENPEVVRRQSGAVADLERAQPHALLERRALGAVLRRPAQGREPGAEGRRPGREDDSGRAAERELEGDGGDLRRRRAGRVRRRRAAPVHRQAGERGPDREDRPARDGAPQATARLPIWVTELSWPAGVGKIPQEGDFSTTENGQAPRLKRAMQLLVEGAQAVQARARVLVHVAVDRGHHRQRVRLLRAAARARRQARSTPRARRLPPRRPSAAGLREAGGRRARAAGRRRTLMAACGTPAGATALS